MVTTLPAPPTSIEQYDFSYSLGSGKFRFRLGNDEWLCDKIAPDTQVFCRYANNDNHHLVVVCQIDVEEINGERWLTAWPPEGQQLESLKNEPLVLDYLMPNWRDVQAPEAGLKPPEEFPQGHSTHYRVCAIKPHLLQGNEVSTRGMFRLRDERAKEGGGHLTLVNGLHGLLDMNWLDGSNHVFADNAAKLDTNGIAHFGGCCDHRSDVEYL